MTHDKALEVVASHHFAKMVFFLLDDHKSLTIKNGETRKPTYLKNGGLEFQWNGQVMM